MSLTHMLIHTLCVTQRTEACWVPTVRTGEMQLCPWPGGADTGDQQQTGEPKEPQLQLCPKWALRQDRAQGFTAVLRGTSGDVRWASLRGQAAWTSHCMKGPVPSGEG